MHQESHIPVFSSPAQNCQAARHSCFIRGKDIPRGQLLDVLVEAQLYATTPKHVLRSSLISR
jgi:hypothetical protein